MGWVLINSFKQFFFYNIQGKAQSAFYNEIEKTI